MEARPVEAESPRPVVQPEGPAPWARPLVRIDAAWTKIETNLVVIALLGAILYMSGWVVLNAFHTKGGKLAYYPGGILTFAGLASGLAWTRRKLREPKRLAAPIALFVAGCVLLAVAHNKEYFANVARWLADASLIKQVGTPNLVSARLFTIWVALLGGSLAASSGRQINIDVVMRFLAPRPRLIVALIGYVAAATACFAVTWAFLDYVAITGYGADKEASAPAKVGVIGSGVGRHFFVFRKQLALDLRSFGHVVLAGQPFDQWYTADEWNQELNEGGWASVYPPPSPKPLDSVPNVAAPTYSTKPCLSPQELQKLAETGGSLAPDWNLPGACSEWGTKRAPIVTAPDPDDGTPFEADLSLLFPWGFFVIGCRFLLRGALAAGGAVSTDPNAAHGGEPSHDLPAHDPAVAHPVGDGAVAIHPPIAETKVDQEARAHVGEGALPADDVSVNDALSAAKDRVDAGADDVTLAKAGVRGEPPHHVVENVGDPREQQAGKSVAISIAPVADEDAPRRSSAPPAEGMPTAQRLEAAAALAEADEDERTLVGDLSELAQAEELRALREEGERKRRAARGLPEPEPKKPETKTVPAPPIPKSDAPKSDAPKKKGDS